MRIARLFMFGIISAGWAAAQITGCMPAPHALPDDLRAPLEKRLSTFLSAEAEADWGQVAELMGDRYSSSYKQCMVSRMQELRMVSFDFSIQDLSTCTTTLGNESGTVSRLAAEHLSWYLAGTGEFQTSSETWTEQTRLRAYRSQGEWYFEPPQKYMQNKWEKVHYTESDFVRDRPEEIEVRNSPSSPIAITDVHVYMDRQFPSLRNIRFKLRNLTPKKITWLSIKISMISNGPGEVDMQGPYQIEPKRQISEEQSVNAYGDFCQGISKHAILVNGVHFAGGSKWEFEEPAKSE
jgi:hypothetical protein